MAAQQIIERLLQENPRLHWISPEYALRVTAVKLKPGPTSFAVRPAVIRALARYVRPTHSTLETGAGHSTVALAALARHHICIAPDAAELERIQDYMRGLGVSAANVTFIADSSDRALPKLNLSEPLHFALVDGCHGYPFPALEWHFIDQLLEVDGVIAFDNAELPAVRSHCDFLDRNGSYRLIEAISGRQETNFYRKERDELREWVFQPYSRNAKRRWRDLVTRWRA